MKIVYVLSGPRGAGKSTYAELLRKRHPYLRYMSRDELSMTLFGATSHDPYTGASGYVMQVLFENVEKILCRHKDAVVLFDCFNGYANERKHLIKKFREWGADRVVCLYLVTPLEACIKWFFQKRKKERAGYTENMIAHDYKLFHKEAENDLDYDPEKDEYYDIRYTLDPYLMEFDAIYRIDPCQLTLPGFPMI